MSTEINDLMQKNMIGPACHGMGLTLIYGTACVLAYCILYVIHRVSGLFISVINYLPEFLQNPTDIFDNKNKNENENGNNENGNNENKNNNIFEKIRDIAIRSVIFVLIIITGTYLKRQGMFLHSDEGVIYFNELIYGKDSVL